MSSYVAAALWRLVVVRAVVLRRPAQNGELPLGRGKRRGGGVEGVGREQAQEVGVAAGVAAQQGDGLHRRVIEALGYV